MQHMLNEIICVNCGEPSTFLLHEKDIGKNTNLPIV